jgi:hypothetical protein
MDSIFVPWVCSINDLESVFFVGLPHLATYIFLVFSTNEPELGAGIDTGMALIVDHFHLVFWPRFEPTTFRS